MHRARGLVHSELNRRSVVFFCNVPPGELAPFPELVSMSMRPQMTQINPLSTLSAAQPASAQQLPRLRVYSSDVVSHVHVISRVILQEPALPPASSASWGQDILNYKAFLHALSTLDNQVRLSSILPPRQVYACWLAHMLQPAVMISCSL